MARQFGSCLVPSFYEDVLSQVGFSASYFLQIVSLHQLVLPLPQSPKHMHDQSSTKIFQMKDYYLLQRQYVNDAVGRKKKRYWSFLTCCAPSPLTIGEVRRGISLLIIEVVSSNGGCSAIIDGTLIHKITCKEKLLKWLNYINISK